MRYFVIAAILVFAVCVGESGAQVDLIFADGFEDGTACAWSNGNAVSWYEDHDGDLYGRTDTVVHACSPPPEFVARDGDCDDNNHGIFPGATATWIDGMDEATVIAESLDCSFHLSTTANLLSGPPTSPRVFYQPGGRPKVSTGNLMFDSLHALALVEALEDSVDEIQSGAYNSGLPIPCPVGGCFEGGRLRTFVWTRDSAYSIDLGLAPLDPTRARNSLEFKLSNRRGGGDLQIVQDHGTGGSYPVSTDRAAWAFGAWRLLGFLEGAERQAFQDLTWDAVRNTVEHDREAIFDHATGLYNGETSFLDWREQSYPAWVADDPVKIAMSQCLSTNVTHLRLLEFGAWLAGEAGDPALQTLFQGWADNLRIAIDDTLYQPDLGMWGSFVPGGLDLSSVRRFDLLGSSLAVLAEVGNATKQAQAVRSYPHLPKGPPVIWPQQKEQPIFHNRAQWPFATAYFLRAARLVRNDAAVNSGVRSMVRGAAINLSNLDAFEFVTGVPWFDDPPYSGPVVNHQRRLWSVAGYLSMVHDVLFGLDSSPDGIRFLPYITRDLRASFFADANFLMLSDFQYLGRRIAVQVNLPPIGAPLDGAYTVGEIRLNGQVVSADFLSPSQLQSDNLVEVELIDVPEPADSLTVVTNTANEQALFSPLTPQITGIALNGGELEIGFNWSGEPPAEIAFNVYRDGQRVASALPGSHASWVDSGTGSSSPSHCYSVESYFLSSNNHSQHSIPVCWWGSAYGRIQSHDALSFVAVGGSLVNNFGRFFYDNWGEPSHTITLNGVVPDYTGDHLIRVTYGNGAGPVSSGITCAVKRVEIVDESIPTVVGSGLLVMPHLGTWDRWSGSSLVPVTLESGRSYRITVFHDATSLNMSDLESNALYTGGVGGATGAFHNVNIAEITLLSLTENP